MLLQATRVTIAVVAAVALSAVAAPGPPWQRVVVVLAAVALGLVCLVVRADPEPSVRAPRPDPPMISELVDGTAPRGDGAPPHGDGTVPPGTGGTDRARHRSVVAGHTVDGAPVTLDATAGILVVGRGALAVAVFRGLAGALHADPDADEELRAARADDVTVPADGPSTGGPMPSGTAVAVVVDGGGSRIASVVLVPDLGRRPRGPCATIDVTRYGCRLRSDPDSVVGVQLAPVLPPLGPPDPTVS